MQEDEHHERSFLKSGLRSKTIAEMMGRFQILSSAFGKWVVVG